MSMTMITISRLLFMGLYGWSVVWAADDSTTAEASSSRIKEGTHPKISMDSTLVDEGIRVTYRAGPAAVYEYDDAPLYFTLLEDVAVETEVEFRVKNNRWSDRVVLEKLYFAVLFGSSYFPHSKSRELQKLELAEGWDILDRESDYCKWEGITCSALSAKVTEIKLAKYSLYGTLPPELYQLKELEHIDLKGNELKGTIPYTWGKIKNLKFLCLAMNNLNGKIPTSIAGWKNIEYIWLSGNSISGTIPENMMSDWDQVRLLDLSSNRLKGRIPSDLRNPKLINLFFDENQLTGGLPEDASNLQSLQFIDAGENQLTGTIPTSWMSLPKLRDFDLTDNRLSGSIPSGILNLTSLESFTVSGNRLTGTIPTDDQSAGRVGGRWVDLQRLNIIAWDNNLLSGSIPGEMLKGKSKLTTLNLASNVLTGSIPSMIGLLTNLRSLNLHKNRLTGKLPVEMNRMLPSVELNLTGNLLTGAVPKIFCRGGSLSSNVIFRQFGCDAVLCPIGTFHPNGAASLQAGCRPCPASTDDEKQDPPLYRVLGRLECPGTSFAHGDLDGDGVISPREILRLIYAYTIGHHWGAQFQTWADIKVNECDLNGIVCVNGAVAKIDLTDAAICTNGERKAGPTDECRGLPAEISLLSDLEVLTLNRRQFLRGTLPSEIGILTRLKYLDISSCPSMTGVLPTEIGRLTNLKYLNLGGCRFNGTVPEQLYGLTNLEKLHLSLNTFTGSISSNVRQLKKLKELMWSRTAMTGSIPHEIGELTTMENLEMYGNQLEGKIPSSLGNCTNLKRIDLFNNKLTGTIPESLTQIPTLQILHVKLNELTGTVSPKFGDLPFLSWFDVSSNRLHGTIPGTFGGSRAIKDFRLGGNMIYEPIPQSLCTNNNVNGGLTRMYGCDGVICPLGTYSDPGHATHSEGCKPCPEGTTTMYLGSSSCQEFSETDILSILFDVMGGQSWNAIQKRHWKESEGSVCDWQGISCDESDEIDSIRFPLQEVDDTDFI